jgi:hypothetical protein
MFTETEKVNSRLTGVFGEPMKITQKGCIELSESLNLKNALFHPKAKLNLVSVTRLMRDNGLNVLFEKDKMEAVIFDPEKREVIARAILQENDLFKIVVEENLAGIAQDFVGGLRDTTLNWHRRLGHLNLKSLQDLNQKGLIKISDLKECPKINCEVCQINKATRKVFKKQRSVRAEKFGDVIHTDVGVFEKMSLGGNYYFITFIDEATRFKNIFFMKKKDEAFEKFKFFRKWFKNQFGFNFKKVNCDGGGEYLASNCFKEFVIRKGIDFSITPPNTPQLNGIAERFNRVLEEGVRCILREADLPDFFWGEALAYVVFLKNRIPGKNQKVSPFELVFGRTPSFKNIQQFGSEVFYLNTYKKKKLEPRARKGLFLGYTQDDFIFRIWDLEKQTIFRSRDVFFISPKAEDSRERVDAEETGERADLPAKVDADDAEMRSLKLPDFMDADEAGESFKNEENNSQKLFFSKSFQRDNVGTPLQFFFENQRLRENSSPIPLIVERDNFDAFRRSNLGGERRSYAKEKEKEKMSDSSSEGREMNEESSSEEVEKERSPVVPRRSSRSTLDRNDPDHYSKNRAEWKRADDALKSRPLIQERIDPNALMVYCFNLIENSEPKSYDEAMKSDEATEWKKAIVVENNNLINNDTWKEAKPWQIPKGALVVGSRWVFKTKFDSNNNIFYKARLVAKGYTQIPGIHYDETTSPVSRYTTVRFILAYAAYKQYEVDHVDVVSAFLNGDLEEEIFLRLPEGADIKHSNIVRLNKSIYGLKQSSRNWFIKFKTVILEFGFKQSEADPCMFYKRAGNILLIIVIYVDDGLIVGPRDMVDEIKVYLFDKFKMRDLGEAKKFLSIEITRSDGFISINQRDYIDKIIQKFGIGGSKIRRTPLNAGTKEMVPKSEEELFGDINLYQQAVGSLLYLANGTRPDIAFAVGLMSRRLISPSKGDWANVRSIISYLDHSRDLSLIYDKKESSIEAFCDSSYADSLDFKSTSGFLFKFGGSAICWRSSKQKIVAVNTMEAELISCFDAVKEALWLQKLAKELGFKKEPVPIFCDNKSAIYWITNNDFSDRSKHMSVRLRRISEEVMAGNVRVSFVSTSDQIADMMTKALGKNLHQRFVTKSGLLNSVPCVVNSAFVVKSELRGSVGVL